MQKVLKVAGIAVFFLLAALFFILKITDQIPSWVPAIVTTITGVVRVFIGTWKPPVPTDAGAKWQQLLGTGATTACSLLLLIFAATGVTPDWWEGVLTFAGQLLTQVIGVWKPPEVT